MSPAATIGHATAAERMQPGLLGIDEAPAVPEVKFSLVGQVQRHAEVRVSPDGRHAHLIVQVVQPPHAGHSRLPITAVYHAHEHQVLDLQQLAARLLPGTLVLLVCRGLDVDAQRGELRAWRCDRITAIAPADAALCAPDHQLDAADHDAAPHLKAA